MAYSAWPFRVLRRPRITRWSALIGRLFSCDRNAQHKRNRRLLFVHVHRCSEAKLGSPLRDGECSGRLRHHEPGGRRRVFDPAPVQAHPSGPHRPGKAWRVSPGPFSGGRARGIFAVAWLWSERKGVFSHQTALALQELSGVLPSRIHLTLPARWHERRFRVPDGVVLHYASVPNRDRTWAGPVPITSPRRTLADCAKERISPDLLREAAAQALRRGVVTRGDLREVAVALEPFGGLAA